MARSRPSPSARVRYDVDPLNRLVAAPAARDGDPLRTLRLDGTWRLTPAHEVLYTLNAAERSRQQRVFLKGSLAAADARSLTVALERVEGAPAPAQQVTLSGRWQVDARNRLVFLARKSSGAEDRLTLQGAWGLGPRHELIYQYAAAARGRRRAAVQTLRFDGVWRVAGARHLLYELSSADNQTLRFEATLRSAALEASAGRLTYDAGIRLERGVRRQRLTFLGAWKLRRDLTVSLEVPYGEGRVQGLVFEGRLARAARDRLTVALRAGEEQTGVTVTFTRKLLRDSELFVRLQRGRPETALMGGVRVRF